jgi:hypothetical protein
MRYLYVLMMIFLFSCNENKRDFFQSLQSENHFLDTFSMCNLKGFGMSDKSVVKDGRAYYQFNNLQNSIYTEGFMFRDKQELYFLPENSDRTILFFDASIWNKAVPKKPQKMSTKSQTVYETQFLGLIYNNYLKDSTSRIELRMSNILNRTEALIFEVTQKLDVLTIEHINCKNDTLVMKFFPKQEVYYKHINKSAVCL